jgi:hypothetical protein
LHCAKSSNFAPAGVVERETAQSETGIFHGYGVADASPGFQAGWSDCMDFLLFHFPRFNCLSGLSE